jgi:hypothetical protein
LAEEAAEFHVDAYFVVFDYTEDPEEAEPLKHAGQVETDPNLDVGI